MNDFERMDYALSYWYSRADDPLTAPALHGSIMDGNFNSDVDLTGSGFEFGGSDTDGNFFSDVDVSGSGLEIDGSVTDRNFASDEDLRGSGREIDGSVTDWNLISDVDLSGRGLEFHCSFTDRNCASDVGLSGPLCLDDIPGRDINPLNQSNDDTSVGASMADSKLVGISGVTHKTSDSQTCETQPSETGAGAEFDDLFGPYEAGGLAQVNVLLESGGAQFPEAGEYPGFSAPTIRGHEDRDYYVDLAPKGFHGHQPTIPQPSKMESSSTLPEVNQEYSRKPIPITQASSKANTTGALVPPKIPHAIDKSALPTKLVAIMASGQATTTITPQANTSDTEITLQFSSVTEANEYPARAYVGVDPTIPTTQEQREEYIKRLIRAMNATEKAEDNPKVVKRFREGKKYCQIRMEIVSWNILDACISRHQYGPLLPGEKPKAPKNAQKFETFEARMDALLEIVRTCKTVVQHLLEPYYMYAIIDDPTGAINRVRSNRSLNKKKSEMMKLGKEAMKNVADNASTSKEAGAHRGKNGDNTPSTPGRKSDDVGPSSSAQQPASYQIAQLPQGTPTGNGQGVQSNAGLVTPGSPSPYLAHPIVGASGNTPHTNPYPTPGKGSSIDLPHNLQYLHSPHYDAQPLQNAQPYYPASGYVHHYTPARPSRLQNNNVVDPLIMGSQRTSTTALHVGTAQGGIQGNVGDVTAPYEEYLGASGLTFQSNADLKRPIGDLEGPNPTGGPDKKLRQ